MRGPVPKQPLIKKKKKAILKRVENGFQAAVRSVCGMGQAKKAAAWPFFQR